MNAHAQPRSHDDEERRARHISVCQELIDLGMKLARAAAQRAIDAHEHAAPAEDGAPPPRDHNLAFSRLAAGVRQAVTLEARIAARAFDRPAPALPADLTPDSTIDQFRLAATHGMLGSTITELTAGHPDRWQIQETLPELIEDTLDAFPDDPLPAHFNRLCQALNLAPDLSALPPDVAQMLGAAPPERWPRPAA